MTPRTVLIVEDEVLSAKYFADVVKLMGHTVCGVATTADDAIDIALTHRPDIALMDVRLKGSRDGVDAVADIREYVKRMRVIYITASTERRTLDRVRRDRPSLLLIKPVITSELTRAITSALH